MSLKENQLNQSFNDNEKLRLTRLASIGQVSAGIAHEVRNPLTAVKGFLQLIRENDENPYLDIALTELDNALLTLNNLLQVSKADLDTEPFVSINLCSEIEAILALFQDQLYRVEIIKDFKNCDANIFGQRNALKKAFFNLFKNAFEAIRENGEITIFHHATEHELTIQLSDSGVGIPQEKLDLIGTPFYTTKENGTGMGLPQVFTTLHKHQAKVTVTSHVGEGTTFLVVFPIKMEKKFEVQKMENLNYQNGQTFKEFLLENKDLFDQRLIEQSHPIITKINEAGFTADHLHETAHKIIHLIDINAEHQLILLAKDRGEAWAKSNLPAIIKLEWFQGLRSLYWDFMYYYFKFSDPNIDDYYSYEKKVNHNLDTFLNYYIISYNEYKNDLLRTQREVIEELSVPIIPLTDTVGILPIIGTMDTHRAKKLQEKTLHMIELQKFKKIIIDLSGVAYLDTAVVAHLFKIIDGFRLLGCNAVVTGIRSEVANTMIEMGVSLNNKVETKADLKQAIEELKIIDL